MRAHGTPPMSAHWTATPANESICASTPASVRRVGCGRFVVALRGSTPTEAHVVITTTSGEEGQVDYGEGPMGGHSHTARESRADRRGPARWPSHCDRA